MHNLEKTLISFGIIDSALLAFTIEDWYNKVSLSFEGKHEIGRVLCEFKECFQIDFKHDLNYIKTVNIDGSTDCKYFVQDIEIVEENGYLFCSISAWPFQGKIVCRDIVIETKKLSD